MSVSPEPVPDEPPRDESPLRPVHVVGDRYRTFAENDRVTTSGAVAKALTTPAPPLSDQVLLVPGQGVTEDDWHTLAAAPTHCPFRFAPAPAPALDGSEVLKLRGQNVLLAALRETGPVTYTAELVVHADSEMVQDHTAERQHLPGMLLMEASCQMIIAVTGRVLAARGVTDAYYTVMHHFEIDFRRFVFPLPAQLRLTVDEMGDLTGGPDRIPFAVTIDVVQGGFDCARARWRYRAFRPAAVFAAEAERAREAVAACAVVRTVLPRAPGVVS